MLRVLRRNFFSTPLLDLSATHFIPPPSFLSLPSLGLFTQTYELLRDIAIVREIQDVVTQGPYGIGTGILVTSLAMRLIFMPAIISSQVTVQKTQKLTHEFNQFRFLIMKLARSNEAEALMKAKDDFSLLKHRFGIKTSSQFLPMTQLPFVLAFYWTLVEMTAHTGLYPGLKTEGFLWFTNLSVPDPYYGLSILLATSAFTTIHVSSPSRDPCTPFLLRPPLT